MVWMKTGRRVGDDGSVTNVYSGMTADGYTGIKIESRKKRIQHANRSGTWEHTTFFVVQDGKELCEKQTMKAAKQFAEKLEDLAARMTDIIDKINERAEG